MPRFGHRPPSIRLPVLITAASIHTVNKILRPAPMSHRTPGNVCLGAFERGYRDHNAGRRASTYPPLHRIAYKSRFLQTPPWGSHCAVRVPAGTAIRDAAGIPVDRPNDQQNEAHDQCKDARIQHHIHEHMFGVTQKAAPCIFKRVPHIPGPQRRYPTANCKDDTCYYHKISPTV